MKLDISMFRYITKEEFRVLTAVEMGMRNHEHVPTVLVESIAKIHRGNTFKLLQNLLRNKLVAHDGQKYDGWRLTYHGYDFLALRALAARGAITAVGRRLGVGKESDVHFAQGADGELVALKLHRLGRISFRAIKEKRDYLKHRVHASWMYMAKLAAAKEFAYMKALADESFPVPTPIDQNRHAVVMSFVKAKPLFQLRHLNHPHQALERLMRLLVRLLRAGIVHGDFNEFNLMFDEEEKITLIDFPQIVACNHPNAEEFFDRDVKSIVDFFRKRMNIEVEQFPSFDEALADEREKAMPGGLKVEGVKHEDDALLLAAHEQSRTSGVPVAAEGADDDEDDEDEETHEGAAQREEVAETLEAQEGLQGLFAEGQQTLQEEEDLQELDSCEQALTAESLDFRPAPRTEAVEQAEEEDEGSSNESEASEAPGKVCISTGNRVRKKQSAKEARANLQKQQKKPKARANNSKCKDTRKAKAEIKEWLSG
eukprot:TRINITY_DN91577_c0_g1_i1.p1 TRINITY_DN91577_c0_g1~~TRINITY_DN91577_c0_g1_i1.p1  ORF type:complete len:484 (+),score=125.11 TRINITY_DN91577_c0_g1_i1:104-1555(+)